MYTCAYTPPIHSGPPPWGCSFRVCLPLLPTRVCLLQGGCPHKVLINIILTVRTRKFAIIIIISAEND